jgi:hypothetical protein
VSLRGVELLPTFGAVNECLHPSGGGFMKPNQYVSVFLLLNALVFCLTHSPAHSGQAKNDAGRGGQTNSHMSGAASNNARWSADPERGWVRADERREQREESRQGGKTRKNGGKHKANGTKSYDYKK